MCPTWWHKRIETLYSSCKYSYNQSLSCTYSIQFKTMKENKFQMAHKGTSCKLLALTSCSQGDWSAGWHLNSPDLLLSQVLIVQPRQINDWTSLGSHTGGKGEREMLPLNYLTAVKHENQADTRHFNNDVGRWVISAMPADPARLVTWWGRLKGRWDNIQA